VRLSSGAKRGTRRKIFINVTSLIDVVFLLLLFFVVNSAFLEQPGLELSLPQAGTAELARRDEVTVRIASDGTIYLGESAVPGEGLAELLERSLAGVEEKRVTVEADARVPHGRVVLAMDAARKAGARSLVVATRAEEAPDTER
jgi:biopolymer transport protein ExbD